MQPGDKPWNESSGEVAFGMSISLYEEDEEEGGFVGDPIADCCAVVCTDNYVIMVSTYTFCPSKCLSVCLSLCLYVCLPVSRCC